mmetsp:Transcript_16073/g.38564  ORF Transcript_16073/g.38564 Transcript_16073/m.38564 type:complete len:242 (+) Transcript_16073:368-1093(+)
MAISKQKVLLPSLSPVVGGGRVASPLRASSPVPPHRLAERQRDGGASLGLWRGPRQLLFDPKQRVEPKPPGLVRLCRAQAVGFRREVRLSIADGARAEAADTSARPRRGRDAGVQLVLALRPPRGTPGGEAGQCPPHRRGDRSPTRRGGGGGPRLELCCRPPPRGRQPRGKPHRRLGESRPQRVQQRQQQRGDGTARGLHRDRHGRSERGDRCAAAADDSAARVDDCRPPAVSHEGRAGVH